MQSKASRPSPLALVFLAVILAAVLFAIARRPSSLEPSAAQARTIVGEVGNGHGPLAGARVRVQGQDHWTATDAMGRFSLLLDPIGKRITAWKDGHYIGGADASILPLHLELRPLPARDCERYEWVDPRADPGARFNCANCHEQIYREWAGGAHAHAATGRYFRDLYGSDAADATGNESWNLLKEYPSGSGVCASCHAPTANLEETLDLRKAHGVAALGVHCDYCHKIAGAGLGRLGWTHGRHGLSLLRPSEGQLFLGPLEDVDRGEDSYSPLYRQSLYCASCHEGVVFGVHVYSTYSEWKDSPAASQGQQCQSCHMKPTGRMTNIAPGKGGIERRPETLGNHAFFAGSQEEMLRQCLKLKAEAERDGKDVSIRVELRTEAVGHRVPTGFVDRHLLLVVEGQDKNGNAVAPVDGPRLPAAAGRKLRDKAGRLYAKLLHDDQRRSPAPFWKAAPEVEDNRLKPDSTDTYTCKFPETASNVHVSLIYRRFWQEVVESKGWGNTDIVVREVRIAPPR